MPKRKLGDLQKDDEGSVLVEAAVTLPLFTLLVMGIVEIGLVINIYMNLTMAAATGLQTFSLMRGIPGSYTASVNAAKNSALNSAWKLSSNDIKVDLFVAGAPCTSSTCDLALSNGAPPSTGGAGATTSIIVQYPCASFQIYNLLPNFCPMKVQMSGIEE